MLLSLVKGLSSAQRCTITCARLTKSGIRHLRPAWPRPRTHTRVLLGVRVFRSVLSRPFPWVRLLWNLPARRFFPTQRCLLVLRRRLPSVGVTWVVGFPDGTKAQGQKAGTSWLKQSSGTPPGGVANSGHEPHALLASAKGVAS